MVTYLGQEMIQESVLKGKVLFYRKAWVLGKYLHRNYVDGI